jgi:hypothetical protein
MCEVRKSAVKWLVLGLAAGVLAGTMTTAEGQKQKKQVRARRETNASRQARIQRTIDATYSHRYEIFGGGGYLRWRSGEYTKRNNEVSWAAGGSYYLNPKLAIIGTAQGSFGNAHALINNPYGVYNPQINEYFFMGGANYRFYRKEKLALSAQGQGGIGWGIFSGGAKGLSGSTIGLWQDGFKPAFSAGVNADYNFYPNLAFRVTPTFIGSTFDKAAGGSSFQSNFGVNAGIVYRFGKQ